MKLLSNFERSYNHALSTPPLQNGLQRNILYIILHNATDSAYFSMESSAYCEHDGVNLQVLAKKGEQHSL